MIKDKGSKIKNRTQRRLNLILGKGVLMEKEIVYTEQAPDPGPYSQAVRYGNLIFVAGQTSEDPLTNRPVHDSVTAQTERIMRNIETILQAAGAGLDRILRVDVYLSSMSINAFPLDENQAI